MKKKLTFFGVIILLLVIAACTSPSDSTKAEKQVPYTIYEYMDTDGCEYLVVYSKEWKGNGQGVGTGISQKVKQPESCKE